MRHLTLIILIPMLTACQTLAEMRAEPWTQQDVEDISRILNPPPPPAPPPPTTVTCETRTYGTYKTETVCR